MLIRNYCGLLVVLTHLRELQGAGLLLLGAVRPRTPAPISNPSTPPPQYLPWGLQEPAGVPRRLYCLSRVHRRPYLLCRKLLPAVPMPPARSGSSGLATTERLMTGQQQRGFGAGAGLCIPLTNLEPIRTQVRPLSATCGSLKIA